VAKHQVLTTQISLPNPITILFFFSLRTHKLSPLLDFVSTAPPKTNYTLATNYFLFQHLYIAHSFAQPYFPSFSYFSNSMVAFATYIYQNEGPNTLQPYAFVMANQGLPKIR
jgi:hypothetical protein